MASLAGKTALITGGSKGIGAAVALLFAQHGANVAINYSSDATTAEELVKQIGSDRAIAIKANAGSIPDIESMVEQTVRQFGKIDVCIPNAATLPQSELADVTEADYTQVMDLNVKGPLFLVQKAVPHMPPGSSVILVSSSLTANSAVRPTYLLYNMTKGAIEQMNRLLSKGLAPKGIVVNIVSPGPTSTELFLKGKSEELLKAIASQSPFQRIGQPEEVAEAFLYLAGPGARWVSGQNLRANGGGVVG